MLSSVQFQKLQLEFCFTATDEVAKAKDAAIPLRDSGESNHGANEGISNAVRILVVRMEAALCNDSWLHLKMKQILWLEFGNRP